MKDRQTDGQKEQTPLGKIHVFSCKTGIYFMTEGRMYGQPKNIMFIIFNIHIIESRTAGRMDGRKNPAKVFSCQIGIDFMMGGWTTQKHNANNDN